MYDRSDYSPTEKGADLGWMFAEGRRFTIEEIASRFSISRRWASDVVNYISRVIPIVCVDGVWGRMD